MKRVFAVIELADDSDFDPTSDQHLDELAEDLLGIASRVRGVATYCAFEDLAADEQESRSK